MTKFYSLLLAGTVLVAVSCRSTSKSFQKGDYTDAIERGVRKLQKDPTDYETRDLVQKSYNYTISQHEDQIRILSNTRNDSRFEKIFYEYSAMQNLYETIHAYPAVAQMIKTKDYSQEVLTYREQAAEAHVSKANAWMREGTKESYREAFKEYNVALQYRPEDFQLQRTRDSVYDAAVTKVIISPIASYGGSQYGNSYQLQNFQRDVLRTLASNMNNGFVRFYTENEARVNNVDPDQVMDLNLSRVSIGQPVDNKTTREVSKEVVVKEIVYSKDSVVKQYGKVNARITTTQRTLISQGDLYITVRDTKGRTIWTDRFTGEHKWQTAFASYTGDERALTEADKSECNQGSYNPPTEDTIMEELLRKIQSDLCSRLRGYYTRFD